MGWGKGESIIEQRREQIGADPKATIQAIREDLRRDDLKPRERVRLLGLLVACHKHTGNRDLAKAAIAEARSIPKAGKIAKLEILAQETSALIDWALQGEEEWETARACSIAYLAGAQNLPRLDPKTDWGRRQERNRSSFRVGSLLAYGQIDLFTNNLDGALNCALKAMKELPDYPKAGPVPEFAGRIIKGVISLLANTLIRGGSEAALESGVAMIKEQIDGLPGTDRLWRSSFAALLGCVAARKGDFDDAAAIFEDVLNTLESIGAKPYHSLVLSMWERSVEHMEEQTKRVQEYLAQQRIKLPLVR